MMLLSGSKSRPQTCSAIIGRVSTRPTLRMKSSSSAYSRAVNATLRWPRVTSRVEDERKVASFIRQGLEEEGHTVEVAADGAAALDLMVAGPPHDLVVLDLMLPKRDGFEVLRQARSK